jgi:hypothetical protein
VVAAAVARKVRRRMTFLWFPGTGAGFSMLGIEIRLRGRGLLLIREHLPEP